MTYPFVVGPIVGDEADLPAMFAVRQHFDVLPAVDVLAALDREWPRARAPLSALAPGASVAVAVGSRGITDIAPVVRGIVARLTAAGSAGGRQPRTPQALRCRLDLRSAAWRSG